MQYLVYALLYSVLVFPFCGFQHKLKVLLHRAVVQQLEVLEDYSHLAAQCRHVLSLQFEHVSSQHLCLLSLVGIEVEFCIHGLQQRTLSRAYLTYYIYELTLVSLEVGFVEHESVALIDIYFREFYKHSVCVVVFQINLFAHSHQCFFQPGLCLSASSAAISSMRSPLDVSSTMRW